MPLKKCQKDGKPGYQWGDAPSSRCYTYTPGDDKGRKAAKRKAILQGIAMGEIRIGTDAETIQEARRPTLEDIPFDDLGDGAQLALVRLLLFSTGEIHKLLNELSQTVSAPLRAAEPEEVMSATLAVNVQVALRRAWPDFMRRYSELIGRGIYEAASIPFGVWAIMHDTLMLPAVEVEEGLKVQTAFGRSRRRRPRGPWASEFQEQGEVPPPNIDVFKPLLDDTISAVRRRRIGDGLELSNRIWRLDHQSRRGIESVLSDGVANSRSAYQTAKLLEGYLGAGADCPRWTSTRLNALTKSYIAAGVTTGLYSGSDCDGQGVAYNALRLARNEMQTAFHMANDAAFAAMPWVKKEQIILSPDHPKEDICDDVTYGGDNGDGVYEKGEISLPLHVQCLCQKIAVLMESDAFIEQLRGWMNGSIAWADMDTYAQTVGGNVNVSLTGLTSGMALSDWMLGSMTTMETAFWGEE